MSETPSRRIWTTAMIFLAAVVLVGGITILFRSSPGSPLVITTSPEPNWQGQIYIGGGVNNPGLYPFTARDTVGSLVDAAGGTAGNADLSSLELLVNGDDGAGTAQKIDINRAEAWLLKALPGIGETLAGRIVGYRLEHEPFHSTAELRNVPGIGDSLFQQIQPLITVGD